MTHFEDDGPAEVPFSPPTPDSEKLLLAIEYMRACGAFDWADDSLRGISDTIEERRSCSAGQLRAVRNIAWGKCKGRDYSRPSDMDRCLQILD